ncbi:hypothetical protein OIE66_26090 [Nonomuraea sp. NBC_01738]|uniref:hypothetical protein n=1 Tax=Nonomuraea sp. NBC_01738 TaxID=2976003 RepID=UPI002E11D50B|nr:hypothetical protein OIE66_26090 [Nonomuraea sp. NBC_01738]
MRSFAVTVLVIAFLGVLAGLAWSYAAPRAIYAIVDGEPVLADPSTQALIGADGWFAAITGGLGLACGAVVWFTHRRDQLAVLFGLCAGGIAAAFLTRWIGGAFTLKQVTVEASASGLKMVPGELIVTAGGVIVAWPLMAVALFGILEGLHGYRESPLRRPYGI